MVLGGHRQIVLVRPSGAALALQVLHYPEQVRSCPLAAVRLPEKADEELRLAGLLIDAAAGTIDWSAYRDQAAQELKALIEVKLASQPVAKSACSPGASAHFTPRISGTTRFVSWRRARSIRADQP
jgi:non-homologous end joining protein Ku